MKILNKYKRIIKFIANSIFLLLLTVAFLSLKLNTNNKTPKISVIVPVYNVEKYLPKCLDSLIHQTLQDIEIICINDGSTDNSCKILEKYQKKDSRIEIINKKNGGISSARNLGIKKARGEYISFIDSDDYVSTDLYKYTYKNAKKYNADILCFGSLGFIDCEKTEPSPEEYPYKSNKIKVYKKNNNKENPFKSMHIIKYTVWDKLFKTSVIKNIYFKEDILFSEDTVYTWFAIPKANTVVEENNIFYYYRKKRPGSIMNSGSKYKKVDHLIKSLEYLIQNQNYFNFEESEKWIFDKIIERGCDPITHSIDDIQEKKQLISKLLNIVEKFFNENHEKFDPIKKSKFENLKNLL